MNSSVRHPDAQFATTLAHGLGLLQCFQGGEFALSNKEMARRSGLSKGSVSRLTSTLCARGLLVYDAHLRQYRLGSATLSLGYPLLASLAIRQVARPLMKRLADQVQGSVSLGMRDRTRMVYVETSRGHDALAFRPDIGASLPMLPTAMGRAWLAQAPDPLCQDILAEIRAAEPGQWTRFADAVKQARRDLFERGFCIGRGDWQPDVHAVSVPLCSSHDREVLVFNCGVPTQRLRAGTMENEIGPMLVELVRRIGTDPDTTAEFGPR